MNEASWKDQTITLGELAVILREERVPNEKPAFYCALDSVARRVSAEISDDWGALLFFSESGFNQ